MLASAALAQTSAIELQRAAIARQRESIRKQAESLGVWLGSASDSIVTSAAEPSCAAVPEVAVAPFIESAAKAQDLQPKLLRAVIAQESGFRPCAVSRAGAQGLMQLMPATAEEFGVEDPFDPKQSIAAGARFLKQLIEKYKGDLGQALGAYNAGPATVDQSGGVPDFPETQSFVKAILEKLSTRTDPPSIQTPRPIGN